MDNIQVSVDGVQNLLQKLNTKKAFGPDKLLTRVLKNTVAEIDPFLQVIFQQTIDTGKAAGILGLFFVLTIWICVLTL